MTIFRLIIGFIIGPLMPGLLAAGYAFFDRPENMYAIVPMIVMGTLFGYLSAILFGVPLYVFLKKTRRNGALEYIVAGAILGALAIGIFFVLDCVPDCGGIISRIEGMSGFLILSIISGMVATFAFWLIVRPDKKQPAKQAVT